MSDHEPIADADTDQPGERLDADKIPQEIPDRPLHALDYGTTEEEMGRPEPLDDRLAREVPDVDVATQAPAETTESTPLMDDADESGRDREKDLVAEMPIAEPHHDDTGQPNPPASAEEQAVRVQEGGVDGATDHQVIRTEGP